MQGPEGRARLGNRSCGFDSGPVSGRPPRLLSAGGQGEGTGKPLCTSLQSPGPGGGGRAGGQLPAWPHCPTCGHLMKHLGEQRLSLPPSLGQLPVPPQPPPLGPPPPIARGVQSRPNLSHPPSKQLATPTRQPHPCTLCTHTSPPRQPHPCALCTHTSHPRGSLAPAPCAYTPPMSSPGCFVLNTHFSVSARLRRSRGPAEQ